MHLQVALVRVSLPTLVTDVLLAAGVDVSLVRPQVTALAETLAADVARVWLLSCVDAQVQLQAVGVVESFVTGAAFKRPLVGMHAAVRDQAALLAERLAALLAAVGALAGVDPLVNLQVHRLAEALPAELAAVRPHAAVDPQVGLEIDGVAEGFGAMLTFEGLLSGVDELV